MNAPQKKMYSTILIFGVNFATVLHLQQFSIFERRVFAQGGTCEYGARPRKVALWYVAGFNMGS